MGGAVSSGSDNNELVDNLMRGKYIRTTKVEQVFRALDRADYMTPEGYDHAYKDLAWRNGPLHLSSPCIYSEVMEGLELFEGLSFLNIGSGTGYLSSLVGLILGSQGINHGVEVHPEVYEFSLAKLTSLLENSPVVDDFDFCQPKFFNGNGLCLVPLRSGYDRVYCGAACPTEYVSYFRNLIKVGGILVMPLNDMLVQVRRVSRNKWVSRSLLSVTFAPLRVPTREETAKLLKLDEQRPPRLEVLSRAAVRAALRAGVLLDYPELGERSRRPLPRARPSCPRRICIPVEPPAAIEGLNVLHDLDAENGADEMNALLSLVISMGQNRVAGALRYGRFETGSNSSDDSDAPAHQRRLPDDSADDSDAADRSHSESGTDEQLDDYDSDGDSARRKSKTLKRSSRNRPSKPQKRDSSGHGSRTQKRDSRSKNTKTQKRDSQHRDSKTKKRELRSSKNQKQESERTQEEEEERGSGRWLRSQRRGGEGGAPSTSRGPARALTPQKLSKRKSKDCKDNSKQDKESCPSVLKDNSPVPPRENGTRAGMEWEESKTDTVEASDEDAESRPKSKAKRQKLDSGIGESTPGSSSPARSRSQSDSDDYTDIEDEDEDEDEKCPKAMERRAAGSADIRCVRVSELMRRSVLQLPLPPALKRFVNLDRANEH